MKKQSKNKKKKKLTSLLLLCFLTIIMISISTYAWFTANRTVTISSLDVNVTASSGLQVSVDAYNWKTVITNADINTADTLYTGAVNQVPTVLKPVSTAGNFVNATSGKLAMFSGTVIDDAGDFKLTAAALTDTKGNGVDAGDYIVFDLFLKNDSTEPLTPLYLSSESGVIPKGPTDSGLKNASRIAFVVEGNTLSSDPAGAQGKTTDDTSNVYIWEPNFDVHTPNGVTAAFSTYEITTTETGAGIIAYEGVKAPIASPGVKLKDANSTDGGTYASSFQAVTPKYKTSAKYSEIAIGDEYLAVFSLKPGITKLRIYMWVEGQDVDCENNASGTDISFNVQFTLNKTK